MKDRTREAIFNLLGPLPDGLHVVDLFAGTGAMALEALSRGAEAATLIECHRPTAKLIRQTLVALQLEQRAGVIDGDAFLWVTRAANWPQGKLLVFCCPPYAFYHERTAEMLQLVEAAVRAAREPEAAGSMIVVETDMEFDLRQLPEPAAWDRRCYRPAQVAIRVF